MEAEVHECFENGTERKRERELAELDFAEGVPRDDKQDEEEACAGSGGTGEHQVLRDAATGRGGVAHRASTVRFSRFQ